MRSNDRESAEHRLHWLLDALRTGPRFRGETFAVAEHELLAMQRALWQAIDAHEIAPRLAADWLLHRITHLLGERLALQRRVDKRRNQRPKRIGRDTVVPPAVRVGLPPRSIFTLCDTPPWLLRTWPLRIKPLPGGEASPAAPASDAGQLPVDHHCPLQRSSGAGRQVRRRATVSHMRSNSTAELFHVPGLRVALERTPGVTAPSLVVRSHADVAPLFARFIGAASDRESIVAALLDWNDRLIGLTLIAMGDRNTVAVQTADVYRPLIVAACTRYYLAHNHPSGRTEPSRQDLDLTRHLHSVGRALGIDLCDHIIIGRGGTYRSLRENGDAVAVWRRYARRARRSVAQAG